MSKNSPHQRLQAFKDWDRFMEYESPAYKERKKKKPKKPGFLPPDEEDLEDYYSGKRR